MSSGDQQLRGRRQLLLLVVLFVAPMIIAYGLVASDWRPGDTTNQGTLIDPAQQIAPRGWQWRQGGPVQRRWFSGYWTLLALVPGPCDKPCHDRLDTLRRARIALDKDAHRVRILALQPRQARAPEGRFAGLYLATAPRERIAAMIETTAPPGEETFALYVVDTRGYRMMRYPQPFDGSSVLHDLEALLKASKEKIERAQRASGREPKPSVSPQSE